MAIVANSSPVKQTTSTSKSHISSVKSPATKTQARPKADRVGVSGDARRPESSNPINFDNSLGKRPTILRPGTMNSEQVKSLQQKLRSQGYALEADGHFGPETEKVVRQFQEASKLKVDGIAGPQTQAGLSRKQDVANAAAPTVQPGKPVDSFTFRSKPQDPEKVRKQIRDNRAQGKTTMVGIDPNNESEKQQKLARMARQEGAKTHLYLEGRGGPTGENGWGKEEWQRTRQAAANVHPPIKLTDQSDSSAGMQEWNRRGWQEHSIGQARQAKADGHDSVEVDNINRLNGGDNTKRTMDFYRQYAAEYAKGDMPTLMMKNQTVSELKSVRTALDNYERTRAMSPDELARQPESVRNHRLPREMFSDYHIFENDGGDLTAKHIELTKAMGIKLLQSKDTNNYGASGNY